MAHLPTSTAWDCSWATSALLSACDGISQDLEYSLRHGSGSTYLAALAEAALDPKLTDQVLTLFQPLMAELCARWMSSTKFLCIISAFGRILPFVPSMAEYAEWHLSKTQAPVISVDAAQPKIWELVDLSELQACEVLLGLMRLLAHDNPRFGKLVRMSDVQILLSHPSKAVRYLATRVTGLYLNAADASVEAMVEKLVGLGPITGPWEGMNIEYRFLSMWEEQRRKIVHERLRDPKRSSKHARSLSESRYQKFLRPEDLSPSTVDIQGILLPCLQTRGCPVLDDPLAPSFTTRRNLRAMAEGLLVSNPLLLAGPPGCGKTSLITHAASRLRKLANMITLHLNEQTDPKLLIGTYTVGTTPGTFTWRPGILTTALKEGRWVLIENIDRATSGVLRTLLPVIEQGALHLPGRSEEIRAANGFRIIGTTTTRIGAHSVELMRVLEAIGGRRWNIVEVEGLAQEDLADIVRIKFPKLEPFLAQLISVYWRLQKFYDERAVSHRSSEAHARHITARDLLKWCRRICGVLSEVSSFTAAEEDAVFLEAVDCFTGSICSSSAKDELISIIAEELRISPNRKSYVLLHRHIQNNIATCSSEPLLRLGRVNLRRHSDSVARSESRDKSKFAVNRYTLYLLERVAASVKQREPVLLVGETGTGKTTCIQTLASLLGRKLVVMNMSQQSEVSDLLGGFRPVNLRSVAQPLQTDFERLFEATFSHKKNLRFKNVLSRYAEKGQWNRVTTLWNEAIQKVPSTLNSNDSQFSRDDGTTRSTHKRRKLFEMNEDSLRVQWDDFGRRAKAFELQLGSNTEFLSFKYIESSLVKSVRDGDWVLLDEINLASLDTLESISDLIEGSRSLPPSLLLTESGSMDRLQAHADFRLFAAMNPATDIGKRELPTGIRSRFTELYVDSPDRDAAVIRSVVEAYLSDSVSDSKLASDVTSLYLEIQRLADQFAIASSIGLKPHFTLRTLSRTLIHAHDMAPSCSPRRALFEGFQMAFMTSLNKTSQTRMEPLIKQYLFGRIATADLELRKPIKRPPGPHSSLQEGRYWVKRGPFLVQDQPQYIVTPSVRQNLDNLTRAVSTGRFSILLEGPTSSGKTSMIEYLAKKTGNKTVRINNHEHTDLQEYFGGYVSSDDGKLHFQDGVLVQALREGYWVILDELNLAPSEVLEALNRLLDDNRELMVPDTQELVRPHGGFMLFATQNPVGLYGGRKILSRALRSRFLELQFEDIPVADMTEILQKRTNIPQSWSKRIVNVYIELMHLRREDRLFEGRTFATLRDLFRWALRKADSREDLALNGYMLLAGRVRKSEERRIIKTVIENCMSKEASRVTIDEEKWYDDEHSPATALAVQCSTDKNVVWTGAMKRLFALVFRAIENNEPVLLVGETGCGKTTVCQLVADILGNPLIGLNAHRNTEASDLLGAQRPIRGRAEVEKQLRLDLKAALHGMQASNTGTTTTGETTQELLHAFDQLDKSAAEKIASSPVSAIEQQRTRLGALFEWADGPLVRAMKSGHFFLLDEISLAEDSVLERLNSVLEPQRTLMLAEKGPFNTNIHAKEGFQIFATMNPGGEYGKRELSPALRNRFTEIWVPPLSCLEEIEQVVRAKIHAAARHFTSALVLFAAWFTQRYTQRTTSVSLRDILSWVSFVNRYAPDDTLFGIVHGALMVFIDTLGANPAAMRPILPSCLSDERRCCLDELNKLLAVDASAIYNENAELVITDANARIGQFFVSRGPLAKKDTEFTFLTPTTRLNAMRLFRAMQISKPILLEGMPGVGKTSLITALSVLTGMPLTRINLSEDTDLVDLFGSDVPAEGASTGSFLWRDGPFLRAMKEGEWVLLDEMNLASQSVLEGLNACLDHRAEVYIAELDQKFHCHPRFRVFAAQNPHHQGNGRKGLPMSFVNRFTVVYADAYTEEDQKLVCCERYPDFPPPVIDKIVSFVTALDRSVSLDEKFGSVGSPWELNVRDSMRWLKLLSSTPQGVRPGGTARDFLDTLFRQRFRTASDRESVLSIFCERFGGPHEERELYHNLGPGSFQVGVGLLDRNVERSENLVAPGSIRTFDLPVMESIMLCVRESWPVILVGPSGSGKTRLIEQLASLTGAALTSFALSDDVDVADFIGGYEQDDALKERNLFLGRVSRFLRGKLIRALKTGQSHTTTQAWALVRILGRFGERTPQLDLPDIDALLTAVLRGDEHEDAITLLRDYDALLQQSRRTECTSFKWIDGTLVRALQEGCWLILDNANACSSSVLDRLNSLLEPNGYLSINECCETNGRARTVRAHTNFRIFLTVDPKYGELSRAIRNRAVELCVFPTQGAEKPGLDVSLSLQESSLYRFRTFRCLDDAELEGQAWVKLVDIAFDHLSSADLRLGRSFIAQVKLGLLGSAGAYLDGVLRERLELLAHLYDSSTYMGQLGARLETAVSSLADKLGIEKTIHPLNNATLRHHASFSTAHIHWLATVHDFFLETSTIGQAFHQFGHYSDRLTTKGDIRASDEHGHHAPSGVSLQKSLTFSAHVKQILVAWCQRCLMDGLITQHELGLARRLNHFWWKLWELVTSDGMNETMSQAAYSAGNHMLKQLQNKTGRSSLVADRFGHELRSLYASSQQTSGWSMERLWQSFVVYHPSSFDCLQTLIRFEEVVDRFDALAFTFQVPAQELTQVRRSFKLALQAMAMEDACGAQLIEDSETIIARIEGSLPSTHDALAPYFASEFAASCHTIDLQHATQDCKADWSGDQLCSLVELLACRPTKYKAYAANERPRSPPILAALSGYLGDEKVEALVPVLERGLMVSFLMKATRVKAVKLGQLKLMDLELRTVGQLVVSRSSELINDHAVLLDIVLATLLLEVLQAHEDLFMPESFRFIASSLKKNRSCDLLHADLIQFRELPEVSAFKPVFDEFFTTCLSYLTCNFHQKSEKFIAASAAWTSFSIGCILIYLPDHPYDPYMSSSLQAQLDAAEKTDLNSKLSAQRYFGRKFGGQERTLRSQLYEQESTNIGTLGCERQVARPPSPEISQLQEEFRRILRLAEESRRTLSDKHACLSGSITLRVNIVRIITRLSENHRAYGDLIGPVIGYLRCLSVGSMFACLSEQAASSSQAFEFVCSQTPLLGASPESWLANDMRALPFSRFDQPVIQMHALRSVSLYRALHSSFLPPEIVERHLHDLVAALYERWSDERDQRMKKDATFNTMYRYRGPGLDDNGDLQEDHDEELLATKGHGMDSNDSHSASTEYMEELVEVHRSLFADGEQATHKLQVLIKCTGHVLSTVTSSENTVLSMESNRNILPALVMVLNEELESSRDPSRVTTKYNFYRDSNYLEAKNLLDLVHKLQAQFRDFHKSWPEHASFLEVLQKCEEILRHEISEPLSKYLSMCNDLQDSISRLGSVASSRFTSAGTSEELNELCTRWTQIELHTWTGLFEIELDRCAKDANEWWFIAYEMIVKTPDTFSDTGEHITDYAKILVCKLEENIRTTCVGQFGQRVLIMEQLARHATLLSKGKSFFSVICMAVNTLVEYFSQFTSQIATFLLDKRLSLDQQLRHIVGIASLQNEKEGNRQSLNSVRSRLTMLSKKYRTVLRLPVEPVINQHMSGPTVPVSRLEKLKTEALVSVADRIDPSASQICMSHLQGWKSRPLRYQNIASTLSIMRGSLAKFGPTEALLEETESLPLHLETFFKSLRKTPTTNVVRENDTRAKHMKTLLRRMFSDTLRDLQHMGFASRLQVNIPQASWSVSYILSMIPMLPKHDALRNSRATQEIVHAITRVLPDAYEVLLRRPLHIPAAEVERAFGSIDSLLQAVSKQRYYLATATNQFQLLEDRVDSAKLLWAPNKYTITPLSADAKIELKAFTQMMNMLPALIAVCLEVLDAQASLGALGLSPVIAMLQNWRQIFKALALKLKSLPNLPEGTYTNLHEELTQEIRLSVHRFNSELGECRTEVPSVEAVLRQVEVWSQMASKLDWIGGTAQDFKSNSGWSASLVETLDGILGSVQDLEDVTTGDISTETKAWFIRVDRSIASAIAALRTERIVVLLSNALDNLQNLEIREENAFQVSAAYLETVMPIIEQYRHMLLYLLSKLDASHAAACRLLYSIAWSVVQLSELSPHDSAMNSAEEKEHAAGVDNESGFGFGQGSEFIDAEIDAHGDPEIEQESTEEGRDPGNANGQETDGDSKRAIGGEISGGDIQDCASDESEGEKDWDSVGSVTDLESPVIDERFWDQAGTEKEAMEEKRKDEQHAGGSMKHSQAVDGQGMSDQGIREQQGNGSESNRAATELGQERRDSDDIDALEIESEEHQPTPPDEDFLTGCDHTGSSQSQEYESTPRQEADLAPKEASIHEDLQIDQIYSSPGVEDISDEETADIGGLTSPYHSDASDTPPGDQASVNIEHPVPKPITRDPKEFGNPQENAALMSGDQVRTSNQIDAQAAGNATNEGLQPISTLLQSASGHNKGETLSSFSNGPELPHDRVENKSSSRLGESEALSHDDDTPQNGLSGSHADPSVGSDEEHALRIRAFAKLGAALDQWCEAFSESRNGDLRDGSAADDPSKHINMTDMESDDIEDAEKRAVAQAVPDLMKDLGLPPDQSMIPLPPEQTFRKHDHAGVESPRELKHEHEREQSQLQVQPRPNFPVRRGPDRQARVFVGEDVKPLQQDEPEGDDTDNLHDVETMDADLSKTRPDKATRNTNAEWAQHEHSTRDLSMILTEQLRLVLEPTVATRLRGDFRTGKRLNLKRIIPYIASRYKRDKIWMRRTVPTRRSYQILLALDDSKSMSDSRSTELALDALALVVNALASLEAGDICVVSFGERVNVAHQFGQPFTHEAGADVLRYFNFNQAKTDVGRLVRESVRLLQNARVGVTRSQADLWQLALIISDGVCEDHGTIQGLVRQAQQERIMLVFVIVDGAHSNATGQGHGQSILDLQTVDFVPDDQGELKLSRRRYLDSFPFPWYLVVQEVSQLPSVMAMALRQWFAEVADAAV